MTLAAAQLLAVLAVLLSQPAAPFRIDPGLGATIESRIAPLLRAGDFAGVIFVAQGGKVVFHKAYGLANRELDVPNTPDTRFFIGSISKQFTAAAILVLEERGTLKRSDPLAKFIPGFPKGDKITLQQLLSHTAGVSRDLPVRGRPIAVPHTTAELVDLIRTQPLDFEPGTKTAYSNNGYRLLAFVIEQTSGQSYGEFLRTAIFAKLGMNDTGDADDQDLIPRLAPGHCPWLGPGRIGRAPAVSRSNGRGSGSLYSTAADLYKWDRSFAGNAVLSEAAKAAMLDEKVGFGTGVFRKYGRLCVGHDGVWFGYTAFVERYPAEDVSIIYLGNVETGGSVTPLREAITSSVFGQPFDPIRVDEGTAGRVPRPGDYVGRYEVFPGLVLEVTAARGHLLLGAGEGDFPLEPRGGDRFFYRLKYAEVRFKRNDGGRVIALSWAEGKRTFECRRL
jgi:CubicO group peptidase (beta-lactamase class C family)